MNKFHFDNHFDNCGKDHSRENYGKQKQLTCNVCNKVGGAINMKRYHFDNCGKEVKCEKKE